MVTRLPSDTSANTVLACVFDWAGTTVDFGSRAPAMVFREAFAAFGIAVTDAQIHEPMGRGKRDHIRAMGRMAPIAEQWRACHGAPFDEAAVEKIYGAFLPRQIVVARERADVIPGVIETIDALRGRGVRIGSTTGYTRDIMAGCIERATAQGYTADVVVCTDDCAHGRPAPDMLWRAMAELEVYPPHRVVKVGDTPADIAEGLNAGTWTVGCSLTGSAMGLSAEAFAALDPDERAERAVQANADLKNTGAHFVVDGVGDLLPIIDAIEARLEHKDERGRP